MKASEKEQKTETIRRIFLFGMFTLIFLFILGAVYIRCRETKVLLLLMLTPGLSALAARLLTGEGKKDAFIRQST